MAKLTDKEEKILATFRVIIPKLKEEEQDKLLWTGEGMAIVVDRREKEEKEEKDKQPA